MSYPGSADVLAALSEEQRMRRIGAFICRVAQFEPSRPSPAAQPFVDLVSDADPGERVLAYLDSVCEASPIEIRATLGLSRSMTYRVLQRLVLLRQVASRGSTKSVAYRATHGDPTRN